MFAYPCPSCRQRLLAPPSRVGQRSICPKCLHPLTVPHPEQVAAGPFAPPAPDPTPDEPFLSVADLPPATGDTPVPMNTMPARSGELPELERIESATEPFLDLAPVLAEYGTPPPAVPAVPLTVPSAAPKQPPSSRRLPRPNDGRVTFDPSGLFGGDAVAQLSAAISMRMAPPPLPASDRTYAIAGWVVGTLVGLAAWVLGVWQTGGWLPFVAVVGCGMAAIGLLWRAYLSARGGSWVGGVITLLPPVCVVQLVRPVAGVGLRPLWFVLSGVGLFGLFLIGGPTKKWVDMTFESPKPAPATAAFDPETTARRLENKADREEAKAALVKAGAAAEPAVRALLTNSADGTVLAACDVLAEIGTADSLPALRKLADDTHSKAVRVEATDAADAILRRLGK